MKSWLAIISLIMSIEVFSSIIMPQFFNLDLFRILDLEIPTVLLSLVFAISSLFQIKDNSELNGKWLAIFAIVLDVVVIVILSYSFLRYFSIINSI